MERHQAKSLTREPGRFARAANVLVRWTGSIWAAAVVGVLLVVWAVAGYVTGYPRAWELAVTVGVPPLTLGLVIVIQHTQTHNNRSVLLKLDELIRSDERAEDEMMRVEEADHDDLERLESQFDQEAAEAAERRPGP